MDTILSKALREFTTGQLNQLIVNLGGQDGSQWENELKRFLRKESCWVNGEVAKAPNPKTRPKFLELVSTVVIPATTKFVAKKRFVINTKQNAPVKISDLGDNFIKWFLSGDGKIEDPISEQQTLLCHKLRKFLANYLIIEKFGGEEKSETMLSDIFSLMKKQKNGKDGAFLSNRCTNIFYIKDHAGVLRVVNVGWDDDGWHFHANSVEYPNWWGVGYRHVFSRNSVLES